MSPFFFLFLFCKSFSNFFFFFFFLVPSCDHSVQSHSQPIRQLSFEIAELLLSDHLPVLLAFRGERAEGEEEDTVLDMLTNFIDGEKDPRCLLIGFKCIETAVKAFSGSNSGGREIVGKSVEGIADVLSCYFPLSFSPPPDMVKRVTRQDLLAALFDAYTSTPQLFPHVVQLLADRFPSPKSETKVDGLSLLQKCLKDFAEELRDDFQDDSLLEQVWELIRAQILHTDSNLLSVVGQLCCNLCQKALEALQSLANIFSDSTRMVDLVFEEDSVKETLLALSSKENCDTFSKSQNMMYCRALDMVSTVASSSIPAFEEILNRTYECILENISIQPVLLIHFVCGMTCAVGKLNQEDFYSSNFNSNLKDSLPELCYELLAYLEVNNQDIEDDYKTTSDCIKSLENCCKLHRDWIPIEVVEKVMMGLLDFSLSESSLASEEHIIQISKIISSVYLTYDQEDLMNQVIARTLTALVADAEGNSPLLVLSVIAEECMELSSEIVLKLTKRAIESYDEEMGPSNKIFCSILSKVNLRIMPHLYEYKSEGIPSSVSRIIHNFSVLLEQILKSPEMDHSILLHVTQSISYTIALCGEEMQKNYSRESIAFLLQEDLGLLKLLHIDDREFHPDLRYLLAGAILNPLNSVGDIESIEDVLHCILEGLMASENREIAEELSFSLSGIINKLDKNQMDQIVIPLVREVLLSHLKSCEDHRAIQVGFNALAWITRSLAMRKYNKLDGLLDEMFDILCCPDYKWDTAELISLGGAFAVVVSTEFDKITDTWKWKAKLLWRQKLFTTLTTKVLAKFKQSHEASVMGLHQILSHLMESVHFSVLKPHTKEIVVHLVDSISLFLKHDLLAKDALMANLELLKLALADENMKRIIQDHVEDVVEGLTKACGIRTGSAEAIKKSALECIALLKNLPHYIIYPHFHVVRRQLQTCLDDSRRVVRHQAGRTLRVWTEFVAT